MFGESLCVLAASPTIRLLERPSERGGGVLVLPKGASKVHERAGSVIELPLGAFKKPFVAHAKEQDPIQQLAASSTAPELKDRGALPPVSLACVVVPESSDGGVLLTQRANRKRGTYSSNWVLIYSSRRGQIKPFSFS